MKKVKNGIILAGGDSDRFWPMTDKNITPFLGTAIVDYIGRSLSEYCEQIYVVTNKLNKESVTKATGNKYRYITQDENQTGMAGALLSCENDVTGEVIVVNGSDFVDFKILNDVCKKVFSHRCDAVLVGKKMQSYFPGGYMTIEGNTVVSIVEKPEPENLPSDLVNLVIDYFRDLGQFLECLKKTDPGENDDWYERGLNTLIKNKTVLWVSYSDYWYALKYPWHILPLMQFFLSGINKNIFDTSTVTIAETAIIQPHVVIQKGVKIGHFAKITGPCFIGEGSVIGDYSLVRESHIGKNSLVGSYTEIARSYIGDNVSFHRNYIGDSVISDQVLFGAGSITANFRFDQKEISCMVSGKKVATGMRKLGAIIGKKTKIGVNTVLFPGIRLGSELWVGPGEKVKKDLADKTFFFDNLERQS